LSRRWYIDSSVVLRVVKEGSPAARTWLEQTLAAGDVLVSSRFMRLEVFRVLRNNRLDDTGATSVIARFVLLSIDNALADEAAALEGVLGGADAVHLASALRVGVDAVTVVTHDRQMASAARALGFAVVDPVLDDTPRPAGTA